MRLILFAAILFGIALFIESLSDSGDRATIEAVIAGLLVATAVCALMENKLVRKDFENGD